MRHPTGEMILLLRTKFRKPVIDDAAEFINVLWLISKSLDRRLRVGENLLIVPVAVHDLLPDVDVIESRQRAHALAHILVLASDFFELLKKLFREKVGVGIDAHGSSPCWSQVLAKT